MNKNSFCDVFFQFHLKMGAYLSEPVVDKVSENEDSPHLAVGASSMQGWRVSQEVSTCLLGGKHVLVGR